MSHDPRYIANTPPSPPDLRDIPFVPSVWPPSTFASEIDLLPNVSEVEDQAEIGSCVANGIVSACEHMAKRHGRSDNLSRLFLYTATLDFENRLGQEGLVPRDALKVANHYGIPSESAYPYDTSKSAVRPPDDMYLLASKTRVLRYEAVSHWRSVWPRFESQTIIDRIKSALNEGLPVGFAMQVTQSAKDMRGPWREQQYQQEGPNTPSIGGHWMVIIGYDDRVGKFLVQNSWGPDWGDGGFGGFPYSIVEGGFFEAWVIRNWAGLEIPQRPGISLEGQNRYRIQCRIVPEPSEVGTTTPLWIGAQLPDGAIWLKQDLTSDTWVPYDGLTMPATGQLRLESENIVDVVKWMNLEPFSGVDVYVAYGPSPWNWKMSKICNVPVYR